MTTAATIVLPSLLLLFVFLHEAEPRFQGLTMGQWLKRSDYVQADYALLVLGTNNLPLLVKRLGFDEHKDPLCWGLSKLPDRIKPRWISRFLSERSDCVREAEDVLERLGTNAAPTLPALKRMALRDDARSSEVLDVLAWIGDGGLDVVAFAACTSTNSPRRQEAVALLGVHRPTAAARQAMTNALNDPDPITRAVAQMHVTNTAWYSLPLLPHKPGRQFE